MADLKPWPELQELLPPLSTQQREALRRSLQRGKIELPILHLPDGRIIDGHHRWELSNHSYPYLEEVDVSEEDARLLGLALNVARRQLGLKQLKTLQEELHKAEELKKRLAHELREQGHTQAETAAIVGVAQNTISDWENITNIGSDNGYQVPDCRISIPPEEREVIYQRAEEGEAQRQIAADYQVSQPAISKIVNQVKKAQRAEEERQSLLEKGSQLPDFDIIRLGDFRELGRAIEDEMVDLIFTDPPYDEEHIPLYGSLAELGARVLKPGGSLICYIGHYALPDVLSLMTPHLRFWWTLACDHSGAAARLPGKWVFVHWKPLLWFVKDRRRDNTYVADMVQSKPVDKVVHEWEQSVIEAEYYIEHLTRSGEMVLDPMCGSGTTCLAALKLNRQTLGIEKDVERFRVAQARIAEYRSRVAES